MMTLVSQIIQDAYRESNLIAIGTSPSAAQSAEALRLLNRLIMGVYGSEAGDQLNPLLIGNNNIERPQGFPYYDPVPDDTNWFVPINAQLILNITSPLTVCLSPTPQDGSRFAILDKSEDLSTSPLTVEANGQSIEGNLSQVFNTNGQYAEYLYRQDTGNWGKVNDLDYTDDMPFPIDFDDMFTIGLAFRLNPRYQQSVDPQTVAVYKRNLSQFKARYRQVIQMPSEWGLILTPGARYWRWGQYPATAEFNAGQVYPYIFR